MCFHACLLLRIYQQLFAHSNVNAHLCVCSRVQPSGGVCEDTTYSLPLKQSCRGVPDRVADCVPVYQDTPLSLQFGLSHVCSLEQNEHWITQEVTHALQSGAKSWFFGWSQQCKQPNSCWISCPWLMAWVQGGGCAWLCPQLLWKEQSMPLTSQWCQVQHVW